MPPKKSKRQDDTEEDAAEVEAAKGAAKKSKQSKEDKAKEEKKEASEATSRSSRSKSKAEAETKDKKETKKAEPKKAASKSKKEASTDKKEEKQEVKKSPKKSPRKSPSPSPAKIKEEKKTPEKKEKPEKGSSSKKESASKSDNKKKASVDKEETKKAESADEEEEEEEKEKKGAKGRGRSKGKKDEEKEDKAKKPMKPIEIKRQASLKSKGDDIPKIFILGEGKIDKDEIIISAWNVNGLRSVVDKKTDLVDYLKSKNPDILCIGETKIDEEKVADSSKWIPSDYTAYFNCCSIQKGYAGTAIITKYKPMSVKFDIDIPGHGLEGRTITLEFEHFYLVHCYVPNAGEGLNRLDYRTKEWDIDFRNYLNGLKSKKHVILCGDLNVCHKEIDIFDAKGKEKIAGYSPQERQGFTDLLESGYVDTFRNLHPNERKYSWWSARFKQNRTENKGWRLDYFVIDKEGLSAVKKSEINNDVHGSDHCPIELTLNPNFS